MFQTTNQYVYVCVQQKPSAPKHTQRWKMSKVVVHHTPMMIRHNQLLVYPQNQQGWFKFCTRPSGILDGTTTTVIFSKIICQTNKWRCPKSWEYHCWGMFHYKTSICGVPRFYGNAHRTSFLKERFQSCDVGNLGGFPKRISTIWHLTFIDAPWYHYHL